MASSLISGCHVMSDLLTIREKGVLFTLLGPQCKLIKTTVAQVLVAKETKGKSPGWSRLGCGAVCLIEDESIHTHILRLYCVKRAKLLWEQELYIPFKYTATRKFFHTFPADGHQIGLNFANETEAEEFHLAVEAVQRNQEKITWMSEITCAEKKNKSTSYPPDSGSKPLDHFDRKQHFLMDAPSTTVTPTSSSDLDSTMRRLLMQSRLTMEDLKDKEIGEAVDCIINQFGGLKAVQRELKKIGPVSQTLPRATGASISLALKKGPLPPVPSIKGRTTSQQTPQCTDTLDQSQIPPWIPPPPSAPAPVLPERVRKSASFKPVGSSKSAESGDIILTALREVFKQKQLRQQRTSTDGSQMEPDSDGHF
ncbi:neural Wiskott-Aldrich syndrome protein isoform X1 [Perca fluviatilis]|uniref:neural Wiskott-Aldrich syndrome protein isoform X1 n=1 Tax=Perca fluviatilis TaxID=8168 RepID=UPI001965D0AC|nr:neural Wiskott-Aldrich syndrome protein isoform X1 [Perca fluviatilis]